MLFKSTISLGGGKVYSTPLVLDPNYYCGYDQSRQQYYCVAMLLQYCHTVHAGLVGVGLSLPTKDKQTNIIHDLLEDVVQGDTILQ